MNRKADGLMAVLLLALLVVQIQSVAASPFILGTGTLTLAGRPLFADYQCPSLRSLIVTYHNNIFGANVSVYAVVHNSDGQIVSIAEANATISAGHDATVCLLVRGLLPSGTYNATVFAVAASYYAGLYYRNVALSVANHTTITVP